MCKRIVTGKYTVPVTFQDKTFIRMDDIFEIKQIGRDMKITLYENAKLNPVGFPALMQKYRRGLQFKNEQEPKILFTPEGSGNVLTALTDLLTELEQLVEE